MYLGKVFKMGRFGTDEILFGESLGTKILPNVP